MALYGDKPAPFASLVTAVQARFGGDGVVVPRPVPDVHATLIGLEEPGIDVPGLCRHVAAELDAAPLTVRFGGFPDRDLDVVSRGRRPYERTLTVAADKVVLIGWPVDLAGAPTSRLDDLRRDLARFGARHRYGVDPDCYVVVADLLPGADRTGVDAAAVAVRAELAASPCPVRVTGAEVCLASYVDPRLPGASTRAQPLRQSGGSTVTGRP